MTKKVGGLACSFVPKLVPELSPTNVGTCSSSLRDPSHILSAPPIYPLLPSITRVSDVCMTPLGSQKGEPMLREKIGVVCRELLEK